MKKFFTTVCLSALLLTDAMASDNNALKAIFLKDLTTGIKYNKKTLPKSVTAAGALYEYFGKERPINIQTNVENVIISIELITNGSFHQLKQALEEKLATDNGRSVQFSCSTKSYSASTGGIDWAKEECRIANDSQRLTLTEIRPTSRRPADVSEVTWYQMNTGSLLLEHTALAQKDKSDKEAATAEKSRTATARAKKDI